MNKDDILKKVGNPIKTRGYRTPKIKDEELAASHLLRYLLFLPYCVFYSGK